MVIVDGSLADRRLTALYRRDDRVVACLAVNQPRALIKYQEAAGRRRIVGRCPVGNGHFVANLVAPCQGVSGLRYSSRCGRVDTERTLVDRS